MKKSGQMPVRKAEAAKWMPAGLGVKGHGMLMYNLTPFDILSKYCGLSRHLSMIIFEKSLKTCLVVS